jgi:hypothetical protein
VNNKLINEMQGRNNRLTRYCFGKLLNLLSLDGIKKYKSQMLVTAWTSYTLGNATGQYRRIGDRCEWIHPLGMSPYKYLRLDVMPNTEVITTTTTGFPSTHGGSAQIVQWVGGGVIVNLGGPVGFGIGNYVTNGSSVVAWGQTTVATTTSANNSSSTLTIPHGVTLKP